MLSAALAVAPVPQTRCTVADPRLAELSGLVADGGELWAMADGGRRVQVLRLDPDSCAVTRTRTSEVDPADPEDLARGPDGSMWVGDIGDNRRSRTDVAVIVLPAQGSARLHRLTYPDGPHDAEALLVDTAGRPVVVTKDVGPAGIYRTAAAPDGAGPTPLIKVGTVVLPESDTEGGPLAGVGSRLVTGAAESADGQVVALRSYTDAWLYRVPGGDVVAALGDAPVRVPLPGEPQGEAIAFTPDGTLISSGETRDGRPGEIRAVPGAVELAGRAEPTARPEPGATAAATDPPGAAPQAAAPGWWPAAVGGAAAAALLLALAGALALRGRRR